MLVLTAMPKGQLPAEAGQLIETHAVGYSEKFAQLPNEVVELVEKHLSAGTAGGSRG